MPSLQLMTYCSRFGSFDPVEILGWMRVDGHFKKDRTLFLVRANGYSMEPRIHDGDYCLFRTYGGGSREGKIVLAEGIGQVDEDNAGQYTIKKYTSTMSYSEDGTWQHETISLCPLNPLYEPISIDHDEAYEFRIVGEFITVIDPEA